MKSLFTVLGLVTLGVAARLFFNSIPNFTPVASLALFAGYVLTDRRWAVTVPFCTMAITDLFLGGYQALLMLTVYAALLVPAFWGGWAQRHWQISGDRPTSAIGSVFALTGMGIASSLLFFLTTNFATWIVTPWYEKTPAGLWHCFLRGLEMFRYTLAGDSIFSFTLFGLLAAALMARHAWSLTSNRSAITQG